MQAGRKDENASLLLQTNHFYSSEAFSLKAEKAVSVKTRGFLIGIDWRFGVND
ncbi:MAG: hypothetical protein M3367_18540 [Acidobacteriota bacterium]|nr:hypothetical protein [Acidobacteriota bacterium]